MEPGKDKKRGHSHSNFLPHFKRQKSQPENTTTSQPTSIGPNDTTSTTDSNFKLDHMASSDPGNGNAIDQPAKPDPLLVRFFDPAVNARDRKGRTLEDILGWNDIQLEQSHDYIQMLFPLPEGSMFNTIAPLVTRDVLEAFRSRPELRVQMRKAFVRMMHFYGFAISGEAVNQEPNRAGRDTAGLEPIDESEESALEPDREGTDAGGSIQNGKENTTAVTNPAQGHEGMISMDDESTLRGDSIEGPQSPIGHLFQDLDAIGFAPLPFSVAPKPVQPPLNVVRGLDDVPAPISLVPGPNWDLNSQNWVTRFDHNHLRITRILRSLRLLGLQPEYKAFYAVLQLTHNIYGQFDEKSMKFWMKAVKAPVWRAPDGEFVEWLRKWVEEQGVGEAQIDVGPGNMKGKIKGF
ncbi:hypothetical protein GQ43DRAFT_444120 [Delitschia confertaspora ATCC 74209]|uniref:Opioid growth factor receptor (OGFr) conserved domain-containing protein n=1 Tax=Delitschia confertaspora ATCC 74209 TaxID=1513339 RepID=A0A9P4JDR6_9PLEO|nr:hypothetical protein GQ43DRAFT_444120 [Delitschia confertaspora ATCC 74209]